MKPFDESFVRLERYIETAQAPNWSNLAAVLEGRRPARPTLFEFFLSNELYDKCTAHIDYTGLPYERQHRMADTFRMLGYDYINLHASGYKFWSGDAGAKKEGTHSTSLNTSAGLDSWEALEAFVWPEPENYSTERLDVIGAYVPEGMGIVTYGPGGVLESLIELVGFDSLCYLLADDPDFVARMSDEIGKRLLTYYSMCCRHDCVRALIYNDDWGYKTQTMISTADLRRYVMPWAKRITDVIHKAGKAAIIHSCGNLHAVMDDVAGTLNFDGKHSYEDVILPVEEAWDQYHAHIAILGGMDVDYVCTKPPADIYERACAMLRRTDADGAYALGTGNSVAKYMPMENYLAMISAAVWNR